MNENLAKVIAYLESANRGESSMSEEVIEKAGEDFKQALRKQFQSQDYEFKARPSNLGRPLCQLQMEAAGARKADKNYSFKMIVTFGDAVEAILKAVLSSCDINYEEGNKVSISLAKQGADVGIEDLSGETDLYTDDRVDDIKSCSPWAYRNKFLNFKGMKSPDTFGYLTPLHLYAFGAKKKVGGWWAVNKSSGEVTYLEDESSDDEVQQSVDDAFVKVKALEDNKPFERCFEDEPETFRKKETGNRVLGEVCSWCDFKFSCWEGLEYKPQPISSAREPRWLYYTHTEDKSNVEEKKS